MKRLLFALLLAAVPAAAQHRPDLAAQRAAMDRLAIIDGTWAGTATRYEGGRALPPMRHTERVGPLIDGRLRLIEGRSYTADGGDAGFNAFAVISYDDRTRAYTFRSYALGHALTVPITVRADGFEWQMAAGPGRIRFVATIRDGRWREEGWLEMPGAPPARTIVLDLKRTGATDWPGAGAVAP